MFRWSPSVMSPEPASGFIRLEESEHKFWQFKSCNWARFFLSFHRWVIYAVSKWYCTALAIYYHVGFSEYPLALVQLLLQTRQTLLFTVHEEATGFEHTTTCPRQVYNFRPVRHVYNNCFGQVIWKNNNFQNLGLISKLEIQTMVLL